MSKAIVFLFNTISLAYTDDDMHGGQLYVVYGNAEVRAKKNYLFLLSVLSKPNTQWVTIYRISHMCNILMSVKGFFKF